MPFPQMPLSALISIVVGGAIFLFMLYFALVSRQEEEPLATRRALTLAFWLPIPYLAVGLVDFELRAVVCFALLSITVLVPVFLLLPRGNTFKQEDDLPKTRIDERDIMFSRNLLKVGSDRFNEYYKQYPERKALDDQFRSHPGLLQKGAVFYDPVTSAATDASFKTVAAFHKMLDDEKLPAPPQQVDPTNMTHFLKKWLKRLGAVSVGVTELRDYHLYSTIGRGEKYGEPVELNHKYAIAFTVEMDKYLLDRAPKGPTAMESAQQYLNSGATAVQLAEFIRRLGYSTRAHIDGSYRVVCPLVARDAGLGEIGRMGLLMTPELGPRVRLAVVTTDLPLVVDDRKQDHTMIDFCIQCKKCADVCPSNAISFEDRVAIDGALRWQIDSEACFTLWCKIGTDCARCMSACPYSHPNNTLHNMVRFGVKRSGLFRRLALKLDNFFYGRKPAPLEFPDWMKGVTDREKRDARS
jgi:ferredoxin